MLDKSPVQRLAERIAALNMQQADEARADEARIAKLPPQEQLAERARARERHESLAREKATLEAIYAIQSVAEASATAAEARARDSADRERGMAEMTGKLLTLTKWLLAVAVITLLAAIVTLIIAA
jgi:hypothetical protein